MKTSSLKIRPMTQAEVPLAIEWAAHEGWNPGLDDAAPFYAADPGGFWIGTLEDNPVAVISAVRSGSDFGFLGFYIVHPDFRGQGHGLAVWNTAMDHLQNRTVGLDGVVDQQKNYRKSGFELAYRNIRQGGTGRHTDSVPAEIVPLNRIPFAALKAFDRFFFPAPRDEFLQSWISQKHTIGRAWMESGKLQGYAVLRKCREGWKFGPLFAKTPSIAESLFLGLQNEIEAGETIFLDTPEPNQAALDLARKYRLTPVFETARMYRGQVPDLNLDGIFGVTTFELG